MVYFLTLASSLTEMVFKTTSILMQFVLTDLVKPDPIVSSATIKRHHSLKIEGTFSLLISPFVYLLTAVGKTTANEGNPCFTSFVDKMRAE